ncbi:MAG: hypothetical protein IIX81_06630, partial [Tidjanibacter sp.]|nr:hypothetical protein [Tidjanibacter sp.]
MRRFFLTIIVSSLMLATPLVAQNHIAGQVMERARELYQMGKYREVREVLRVAVLAGDNSQAYAPVVLTEARWMDAMCQAQMGNGIDALAAFVADYPTAMQTNRALLVLGGEYFEAQRWEQAVATFARVKTADLDDADMEEYCFRYGYSAHKSCDDRLAREWLRRLDRKHTTYYPHARYLLGYISYTEGLLVDSKLHFGAVAAHDDYKAVVPYYLLNIEFLSGNDEYVSQRAEGVLAGLAGARRAEVERVAAQSNFRLEKWNEAEGYIALL